MPINNLKEVTIHTNSMKLYLNEFTDEKVMYWIPKMKNKNTVNTRYILRNETVSKFKSLTRNKDSLRNLISILLQRDLNC